MIDIELIQLHRWTAAITYRRDSRNETRLASFEELKELHDIIECGPDFGAIDTIVIRYNHASTTIERAERT